MVKIVSIVFTLLVLSLSGKDKFIHEKENLKYVLKELMLLHHAMHVMIAEQHGIYQRSV
jgi:hypothetical protein